MCKTVCPKCGEQLEKVEYTGIKYWDSSMPFYMLACQNYSCNYVSPVGCSDYGEVGIVVNSYLNHESGIYEIDADGNTIKIINGPFIDDYIKDNTLDINDYVEYWHTHETEKKLREFLGFSREQMAQWAKNGDDEIIPQIAKERIAEKPIKQSDK